MAKAPSKRTKSTKTSQVERLRRKAKSFVRKMKEHKKERKQPKQIANAKYAKVHRSFRRTYREDYNRKTETPGLLAHAATTFQLIFRNWKIFLPFIGVMVVLYILMIGLLSEDTYVQFQNSLDESGKEMAGGKMGSFVKASLLLISTITTGGLSVTNSDSYAFFNVFLFLMIWLVTIFIMRYLLAGKKIKLREALYNAMAPIVPVMVIFGVIFLELIPILLVIITYSAAVTTGFLSTPFYALVYFIFAALMVLCSVFLLSGALMALVAVAAPGLYPMVALSTANNLVAGRRIKLLIRVVYLFFVISIVYIIVMMPIILIDMGLKSIWSFLAGWPIVPFFLLVTTCFVSMYAAAYFYQYYRWLLDAEEK